MPVIQARTILKLLGGIAVGVAVLAAAGWFAFVPFAQEPGYEFVKAWGGKGSEPGRFDDPTGIAVAWSESIKTYRYTTEEFCQALVVSKLAPIRGGLPDSRSRVTLSPARREYVPIGSTPAVPAGDVRR